MRLLDRLRPTIEEPQQRSLYYNLTGDPLANPWTWGGQLLSVQTTMQGEKTEAPGTDFCAYAEQIYKRVPVVWAAIQARSLLLSETTFKFRNLSTKKLYGDPSLTILEKPWPNGRTGELLTRMEQDASLAGNFYAYRDRDRIWRLDPGRVDIVLSSTVDPRDPSFAWDCTVVGYLYRARNNTVQQVFTVDEIVHYSPVPDPTANYRGMSWITPVIQHVLSDMSTTAHRQKFFDNAATPNLVVKFPEALQDTDLFKKIVAQVEESHTGIENAYKSLYLMAGADATVIGQTQHLDFRALASVDENRIAVASRVPASVLQTIEGLQGSSLNAGNFGQSQRQFTDNWYSPTIKEICGVLEPVSPPPAGSQLWFDTADIAAMREDGKDAATIRQTDAQTIRTLIDAGYEPDTVVAAVQASDMSLLKHTGLYSVQLQEPGVQQPPTAAPTNGAKPPKPQPAPA